MLSGGALGARASIVIIAEGGPSGCRLKFGLGLGFGLRSRPRRRPSDSARKFSGGDLRPAQRRRRRRGIRRGVIRGNRIVSLVRSGDGPRGEEEANPRGGRFLPAEATDA